MLSSLFPTFCVSSSILQLGSRHSCDSQFENKTETALGITNSTILLMFTLLYQNLNRLSQKEEEA